MPLEVLDHREHIRGADTPPGSRRTATCPPSRGGHTTLTSDPYALGQFYPDRGGGLYTALLTVAGRLAWTSVLYRIDEAEHEVLVIARAGNHPAAQAVAGQARRTGRVGQGGCAPSWSVSHHSLARGRQHDRE